MVNQISPGLNVSEVDLTAAPQAVATTGGGFAGFFRWGPVEEAVRIPNEERLFGTFGGPLANTLGVDFLMAAAFLSYSNALDTVRVVNRTAAAPGTSANTEGAWNAIAGTLPDDSENSEIFISGETDYEDNYATGVPNAGPWVAKYPGEFGNSLRVNICPSARAYEATIGDAWPDGATAWNADLSTPDTVTITAANNTAIFSAPGADTAFAVGDTLIVGDNTYTVAGAATVDAATHSGLILEDVTDDVGATMIANTAIVRRWEFFDQVNGAPGTSAFAEDLNADIDDEVHIVITDETGNFGTAGAVLEVHEGLSLGGNARTPEGTSNYYRDAINRFSEYVFWADEPTTLVGGSSATEAGDTLTGASRFDDKGTLPINSRLTGGHDGVQPRAADYINGYNILRNADTIDASIIIGPAVRDNTRVGHAVARHVLENIGEVRRDVVCTVSPALDAVTGSGDRSDEIVTSREHMIGTSFGVMDSSWKLTYDKYNDTNRYIPLCADVAGTMVFTDLTRDPWFSPAGAQRGRIRNVIRLAYNPSTRTERDALYRVGVNPIVTFAGEGTILFGDKTLLRRPSAFDRINVRRLFNILRRSITRAANDLLFEFNDDFTRAQFLNLVTPYLRTVQGRRGITDFLVVADGTNNPPDVVDRGEFVGAIFVKPSRSINFITLRFVATRTGVDFQEIVGIA